MHSELLKPSETAAREIRVPFLDLAPSHEPLRDELLQAIARLIESGAFTNGPDVAAFERAFAKYCGRELCVGAGSGLDALRMALIGGGLERGDEVIVPAATFVATLEAVTQAGGNPVVVDIGAEDYCIDAAAVEAALTPRTRFVIPVHLYGQVADMRALGPIATRSDVRLLEDAAQAHGATRDGLAAGAVGWAAAFSFYPGKNLGAFGDAGAAVTDDRELAERLRALREHGQRRKYVHDLEGFTSRLDTLQALVLLRKLPLLDVWNDMRRTAAAQYSQALDGVGDLVVPQVPAGSDPVWHVYVVRTANPESLAEFLRVRGIGTGRHYPQPVHLAPAYAWLGHRRGEFPVAETLSEGAISVPMYPGITEEQVTAVVDAMRSYFSNGRRSGQ
jgi:dTDP-4-amino-4,6-dideoxygalactose transaminase